MLKSKYTSLFNEALEKLNIAQREAVEHIEGPVLVIAGPGTGKTQILAMRTGKILQETDTSPGSILCLTYTDTGRVEMRNRLFGLIGPDAYRVNIHTFHSFCNEVIQDNATYFGRQNMEPISELEEVELFKELLNELPAESPLKRLTGDADYDIPRIRNLYSLIKKENWTVDFLNERIDAYLESLPDRDEYRYKKAYKHFKAGDLKPGKIEEETEKMEKLREAVNQYPVYRDKMEKKGRYTFDDMLLWVLEAYEENNNILLNYQERFLYFLVDEFQDTSGSQKKLLEYLIGYWDVPNVFVVGDDDQSIYSFQDANVKNITDFAAEHSNGLLKVVLSENYRSTQNILESAKALISRNVERFVNFDGTKKNLIASNPKLQNVNIRPQIIEYLNPANEAICIANKIEDLINTEKVKPSEIAVIYRNHKQVEELANYLEKNNIRINMKRNVNLLELPFIHKILRILEFIACELDAPYSGDELLFEILHYDFFNIPPIEIARLSMEVAQKNYSGKKQRASIRLAISEEGGVTVQSLFSDTELSEVKKVSNQFETLIKAAANITLQGLFEEVVRISGILNHIVKSPEKPWLMQVLTGLFDFIKAETRKEPNITLQRLLDMIETMRNNKIRLNLVKISSFADGVNLVTAHGSKGTEYEYVFLIGCNKKTWDDKKSSAQYEFKLPDNFSQKEHKTDDLEEARRLFYVGMTRAKTHLSISYSIMDNENNNRLTERSTFVSEVLEGAGIIQEKENAPPAMLEAYMELNYSQKPVPEIELVDKSYIDSILENYSLSVTNLNNYLDCPIRFYYQNLIRVPAAKGESMAFGSAVHSTLQALFEKMKANSNVFPSKEIMLEDFRRFMVRNREAFTKEQYNRKLEYGNKILPPYYDYYVNKWNRIVIVEKAIRNVEVEGVPLNGKIDKMEFDGKKVNVVDYKTGKYERAKEKLMRPNDKNPNGGDYWRQAVFYKILLDNQRYNDWDATSTEFDFVEPVKEEYKTEKFIIQKEDIHKVLEQITDTWQKIQNHEFSKGCGKEDCQWCRFVKENQLQVALHEVADEE